MKRSVMDSQGVRNDSALAKWLTGLLVLLTTLWLILLVVSEINGTAVILPHEYLLKFNQQRCLYMIIYIDAGLLTLVTATLMVLWTIQCATSSNGLRVISIVTSFVYGVVNSFVYFSQVLVVPRITKQGIELQANSVLLDRQLQWLQLYPQSRIASMNLLAYAILAIPSIVIGLRGIREQGWRHWTSLLLVLSGAFSILAYLGVLVEVEPLTTLSLLGGAVFLISMGLRYREYCRLS